MAKVRWKPGAGSAWRDKRDREHPSHGKIVAIPDRMQKTFGRGTMLIPSPRAVDEIARTVRKGRVLTLGSLRAALAARAGADSACPLTTGIFVRIVAEAAEEDRREGLKRITPYWRIVRDDGSLIEKFPGGASAQARRLRGEGVRMTTSRPGASPKVANGTSRAG
ncbi:hypothetical protein PHYC_01913 [Phycisphaerales bacterium]|nr:hypothetical protein PHYC_01913 [Phycisphaerales bacterium]